MTTQRFHEVLWLSMVLALLPVLGHAEGGDPTKGREVYELYCAACHGERGRGDGELAASLNPHPRNLVDRAYMDPLSDEYLTEFITRGGGNMHKSPMMPSWGPILRKQDVRNVVSYIRRLSH